MAYPHAPSNPSYSVGRYDETIKDWYFGGESQECDWALNVAGRIAVKYKTQTRVTEHPSGKQIALFGPDGKRVA